MHEDHVRAGRHSAANRPRRNVHGRGKLRHRPTVLHLKAVQRLRIIRNLTYPKQGVEMCRDGVEGDAGHFELTADLCERVILAGARVIPISNVRTGTAALGLTLLAPAAPHC